MSDPYKPPFPASQIRTPEQRKEWLAWYEASRPERDKQSKNFDKTAGFCLVFGFFVVCVVPLIIVVVKEVIKLF